MADDYVQVAADGVGKKVDSAALVRSVPDSTGTPITVERQRVAIGSDSDPSLMAAVNAKGELHVSVDHHDVIVQLKRIALLLEILTNTSVSAKDIK